MANFEDLRMIDEIQKFQAKVKDIAIERNLSGFHQLGGNLQAIYNFYLTAENSFLKEEEAFKSLFSSFNYAAVLINNAIKNKGLQGDDSELINECLEVMNKSCEVIIKSLQGN
jgi:NADPH-dependent 7-cyano-7-deazaguanine reductase QueF-like protein